MSSLEIVAALFGVTTRTINRWTHQGKLRATFWTPGRQRRYSPQAVQRLLKERG